MKILVCEIPDANARSLLEWNLFINSSPLGQNGHNFTDNIFQWIFTECVPKVPIDNKSALVYVMAWRQTGDKPLTEPMLTQFTDAYLQH